jgi:hypothetical protein
MQTLEALALKEADPQVRRAAAWALAAAAIAARSGPSPGVAARPGTVGDRVSSPLSQSGTYQLANLNPKRCISGEQLACTLNTGLLSASVSQTELQNAASPARQSIA